MELTEFAKQVQQMRQYQSEYFANRTPTNLFKAKQQEAYVDDLIEGILNLQAPITQLNMFKTEDLSVQFERMTNYTDFLSTTYVKEYNTNGDSIGAYGTIHGTGIPVIHIYDLPENRIYFLPVQAILGFIRRLAR